jgi:hypothetical protein
VSSAIARLDEVAARQWSQPGGVDPSTDPIVQELVELGPDAIEPLVRVVEDDDRLTRSVEFHRDFSHGRHLLGVQHAAFAALAGILGTRNLVDELDLATEDGRHAAAAAIRRFARSHAGASPAERWLAVLGDDRASPAQWLEAAGSITGFDGVVVTTGWGANASAPRAPPSPMPGESLRGRRPGPTELMVRRLRTLRGDSSQVAPGTPYRTDVLQACRMAVHLGAWDPAGAAPVLREEIARGERLLAGMDAVQDGFDAEYLVLCAAFHTLALVRGGDGNALADYTRFLRALPRAMVGSNTRFAFEPIWVHHDDPAVVAFTRWAFGDRGSPWLPITGDEQTDELLETPMVQLPAFRDRVLVELADRSRYGEVRVLERGGIAIEGDGGRQDSVGAPADDLPARGTILPVRRCDYTAHLLLMRGPPGDAPAFRIHWPVARRDRAIGELIAYLRALPPLP